MKSIKPKCIIILRGGLGNQLFQIASTVGLSKSHEIVAWSATGMPRTTNGIPDIEHLELPAQIKFNPGPKSRIVRKLLAVNLYIGVMDYQKVAWRFLDYLVRLSLKFILIRHFGFKGVVISGKGVGYHPINIPKGDFILNGYFQAENWVSEPIVFGQMQGLRLKFASENFLTWKTSIGLIKPIVLHIRLGDYRMEEGIGILSSQYFHDALNLELIRNASNTIWIFTDEPQSIDSKRVAPAGFNVQIFKDLSLNPAETLELMRHGSAYVISNSTFSWWSAYLRHDRTSAVALPQPWFKLSESPVGIAPKDWIRIYDPFR